MASNYPLVSVIVPVYNVEHYLEQCVNSLVAQDYPTLEIVLVDDGATDSSGLICDKLSKEHENVVAYHKANGGLSDARNYGLAHSHGEWIAFVDSDDYVSPVFISTLYRAADKYGCPIAAVPGGADFHDGETCELTEDTHAVAMTLLDSHEILKQMLYQQITTGAQWRLYRRDTLGEDPFPKGLYYEDLASTYKFIHKAGKVALVDCRKLYAYRLRSNSIIRQSYRHIKGYSAVKVATQLYHDISDWYPDLAVACSSRCFSVCRMVYGQVPKGRLATKQDRDDQAALWSVIEINRDIVANDSSARPRERLAARIAQVGEGPFSVFCWTARRLGKMQ